jgi:hypothetical protein
MATEPYVAAHPQAAAPEKYNLEAVNNARVAIGKSALSKVDCEATLKDRPKAPEPQKVDPKSTEPPVPPEFRESDAQYLVALPTNYVHPTLDEGRMRTTPPAAPRSSV